MCMFIYVCYSPVLEEIKTTYLLTYLWIVRIMQDGVKTIMEIQNTSMNVVTVILVTQNL